MYMFKEEDKARSNLIVVNFATEEKVSKKYIPSTYVKPLVTNLALYLSIVPSELNLVL